MAGEEEHFAHEAAELALRVQAAAENLGALGLAYADATASPEGEQHQEMLAPTRNSLIGIRDMLVGVLAATGPTDDMETGATTEIEDTRDISEELAASHAALVDRHTLLIKGTFLPLYGQYDHDILKLFHEAGANVDLRDIQAYLQEQTGDLIERPDNLRGPIRELIKNVNDAAGMEVIQTRLVPHGKHRSNIYSLNPSANFVILPEELSERPEHSLYDQIVDLSKTDRLPPTDEPTVIKITGTRAIEVNGHTYTLRERALFAFNALLLSRGLSPPALLRAYPEFEGESTHFARGIAALQKNLEEANAPDLIVDFGTTHNRLIGFGPNIIFEDERRAAIVESTPGAVPRTTEYPMDTVTPVPEESRPEQIPRQLIRKYRTVSERAKGIDLDAQRTTEFVQEVSEATELSEDDTREMLFINAVSSAFSFNQRLGSLPNVATLEEHKQALLAHVNTILQDVELSPMQRATLTLSLQLPPDIPALRSYIVSHRGRKQGTQQQSPYENVYHRLLAPRQGGEDTSTWLAAFFGSRDTARIQEAFDGATNMIRLYMNRQRRS